MDRIHFAPELNRTAVSSEKYKKKNKLTQICEENYGNIKKTQICEKGK